MIRFNSKKYGFIAIDSSIDQEKMFAISTISTTNDLIIKKIDNAGRIYWPATKYAIISVK